MSLESAIFETLVYSDIFDYPLTIDEIHRYLVVHAARNDVLQCVRKMETVKTIKGYCFLAGRDEIAELRERRERVSKKLFARAMYYGRILGKLPFIRMVTLTGSLAVHNCDMNCDYDYMLVTKASRVWLARAFALLLNRVANLFGETLCPNLIVSENSLEWSLRNLYTAREISQMILIDGEDVYSRFHAVNNWVKEYFPNIKQEIDVRSSISRSVFQMVVEFLLGHWLGDVLEAWEMKRKTARFTRQDGYGLETEFNAEICQGNFGHHGMLAMEKYQKRLNEYELESINIQSRYMKDQAGYVVK